MNSDINRDVEVYERVENLCKKIEAYSTKVSSIKNEVKTVAYTKKVKKLVEMISFLEKNTDYAETIDEKTENINEIFKSVSDEEIKASIYDPNSANFCYKDRLDRANGNVSVLLEELKNEDKIGHRNAYVINEIKKHVNTSNSSEKIIEQEVQKSETAVLNVEPRVEERINNVIERTEGEIKSSSTSFISIEAIESTGVLHGFFETETIEQKTMDNSADAQEMTMNNNTESVSNKKTETMPVVINQTSFWDEIMEAVKSVIQSIKDIFK